MLTKDNKIWVAQTSPELSGSDEKKNICLLPNMANRHGLIAGATGTGKTITMKVLAESFSDMGVPVFFSDVKGDLSGCAIPGEDNDNMKGRIEKFGLAPDFKYSGYPVRFWDIFGEKGSPVRVTISGLGPVLLSRLLGLTEVQEGVLNIVFKVADEHGLLLLDLKDLRSMLAFVGENASEYTLEYGNISSASVGAIQRALLAFENEGGECMFGEPMLDIRDWFRTAPDGRGYMNILESSRLIQSPTVYSTFLLWMLTEIYERLPEVGDLDKPRFVFFFDEAHMLFDEAPKSLVQKIEQVVKLVRSKGVGVYFVTQNPADIPDSVLAQLSNRIQHGLRAYTPAEQKNIKAAANAFRANENFKTADKLLELGTGEALISLLDEKGTPGIVEAVKILPPQSFMGAADESKISSIIVSDEFDLKYRESVDRESAYEILQRAREELSRQQEEAAALEAEEKQRAAEEKAAEKERAAAEKAAEKERLALEKQQAKAEAAALKAAEKQKAAVSKKAEQAASNAMSSVARSVSTNIINSVTGGKTKSASQIAKQAANSALSSVMRSASKSIVRGFFGNTK